MYTRRFPSDRDRSIFDLKVVHQATIIIIIIIIILHHYTVH
jgi:hypothetical protein